MGDKTSDDVPDDIPCCTRKWYFSKEEIEEQSPSRRDGIDFLKESHTRRLYCSFLKELGKTLKVPQMTIATALLFCHRFYMRQSHAKNSWQIVAASSMFLSSKVEDTPRLLRDVVIVSYEIINNHDTSACNKIRQKEIYEEQKHLILMGERLLMSTMAFDFNIQHPYKPLVAVLKSLEISHRDLARVAWNFVNDWLCTTLCLQFKPHYIAAGSLFLAAKLHDVKLPKENGRVWWHMFEVSPKHLELAIQAMIKYLDGGKNEHNLTGVKTSCSQESCISNGQLRSVGAENAHEGRAEVGVRKRLREGEDFLHDHVDKKRITTL